MSRRTIPTILTALLALAGLAVTPALPAAAWNLAWTCDSDDTHQVRFYDFTNGDGQLNGHCFEVGTAPTWDFIQGEDTNRANAYSVQTRPGSSGYRICWSIWDEDHAGSPLIEHDYWAGTGASMISLDSADRNRAESVTVQVTAGPGCV